MRHPHTASSSVFAADAENLRRWLFEAALPLWWDVGADRAFGGYHERIDFNGKPAVLPRRSRVAARQALCYCEAGRLGWKGPWREAGWHALNSLRKRFLQSDGSVISAVGEAGQVVGTPFDLYNQAFALLAYACGHASLDPGGGWRSLACTLVETLKRDFAHPAGGFYEDREHRLPLRANPHMHLLEAALAWQAIDSRPLWRELANELVALCLQRFVDPQTDALREHFTADWRPSGDLQGEIVEPGHHYEWAYLLARWAASTGRERPGAVAKLIAFADAKGIDRNRRVAINALKLDGRVHDPVARLWPQTERIRAYIVDCDQGNEARLREAIDSLYRYLDAPRPGLWYENLAADGRFIAEAAPATSLYHIVGAIAQLWISFGPRA